MRLGTTILACLRPVCSGWRPRWPPPPGRRRSPGMAPCGPRRWPRTAIRRTARSSSGPWNRGRGSSPWTASCSAWRRRLAQGWSAKATLLAGSTGEDHPGLHRGHGYHRSGGGHAGLDRRAGHLPDRADDHLHRHGVPGRQPEHHGQPGPAVLLRRSLRPGGRELAPRLQPGWSTDVWLFNGEDRLQDNNHGKTLGLGLTYNHRGSADNYLSLQAYRGPEQDGTGGRCEHGRRRPAARAALPHGPVGLGPGHPPGGAVPGPRGLRRRRTSSVPRAR